VRGAVTVGEARDSESVDEISDGINNLADDRVTYSDVTLTELRWAMRRQ